MKSHLFTQSLSGGSRCCFTQSGNDDVTLTHCHHSHYTDVNVFLCAGKGGVHVILYPCALVACTAHFSMYRES